MRIKKKPKFVVGDHCKFKCSEVFSNVPAINFEPLKNGSVGEVVKVTRNVVYMCIKTKAGKKKRIEHVYPVHPDFLQKVVVVRKHKG